MTLQEWMDKRSLKDTDMAERLGGKLSRSQISRIRRLKSIPTLENARVLEAATKIPAAKFLLVDRAA